MTGVWKAPLGNRRKFAAGRLMRALSFSFGPEYPPPHPSAVAPNGADGILGSSEW
jgi:hypothetical protein